MEKDPKIYEIGYLLNPLIPEEKIDDEILLLRHSVEQQQGLIINEQRAKMQKLAYTIKRPNKSQFDSAHFGWIRFMSKPDIIGKIKNDFDKNNNIVRFLILEILKEEPARIITKKIVKRKPAIGEKPKIEIKAEEIDKKLEEILKKY
ncbi:MAG: 30S ribosomal protein S6 [Patescibacteria group bacterium]